jgi:Ser/Thr protein kinase RdoA (MazF antagonist)
VISSDEPVRLPGGNVAPVYRVGDTVRRVTGPWTPAIHALLRHLDDVGFAGAPRVMGIDDEGREVLSFMDGSVPYAPDIPAEIWTDDALVTAAELVGAFHNAAASFEPPGDARWRVLPGAPSEGEIICHNDLAPWNTVYRAGLPTAFIDWDLAAPAPRLWDVAYAAWRFVPLRYNGVPGVTSEPDVGDYARRLRLFCDAYELESREALLDTIELRQQVMFDTVRLWGQAGVPGFAEMWATGHAHEPLKDREFLRANRATLERAL